MKHYMFTIIIAVLWCLLSVYGNCNEEKIEEDISLSKILAEENILAMNYWDVNDETILCIVTLNQIKMEGTSFPDRRLKFYKKTGDKLIKIYEFAPGGYFSGIHPLYDGNLMTIWVGGSALNFYVFALIDKEIKLVLEAGSKAAPEIVDIDNDEKYEILIWKGDFEIVNTEENKKRDFFEKERIFKWKTADIYKWDNKSYKLIKTVPWENRFNALKGKEK